MVKLLNIYLFVFISAAFFTGCWDPSSLDYSGPGSGSDTGSDTPDSTDDETDSKTDSDTFVSTDTGSDTGGDSDSNTELDTDGPPDLIEIKADLRCINVGGQVHFSAVAAGEVTGWRWDFGDTVVSTSKAPSHFYNQMGEYSVSLTVSGPDGPDDTVTVEKMIRVITPGWTRVSPLSRTGDARMLNYSSNNYLFVTGYKGFKIYNTHDDTWNELDFSDIYSINMVSGYWSDRFLIAGKNSDYEPVIYYYNGDAAQKLIDTGNGSSPFGSTADRVSGVQLTGSEAGYAAIDASGGDVNIWKFQLDTVGSNHWTKLPSTGEPYGCAEFYYKSSWPRKFYILYYSQFYVADKPSSDSEPINWTQYSLSKSYTHMKVAGNGDLWLSGDNGEIARAVWNTSTSTYDVDDYSAEGNSDTDTGTDTDSVLWTSEYNFLSLSLTHDSSSLYLVAENRSSAPDNKYIVVKVTDLTGTPVFTTLDTTGLVFAMDDSEIAAYDDNNVYVASSNGYVAKYNGTTWSSLSGDVTPGRPSIISDFTPSGNLVTVTGNATPDLLMIADKNSWDTIDIPSDLHESFAYSVSDDEMWLFGEDGVTYHFVDNHWSSVDIGITLVRSAVENAWGSSDSDIWVIGREEPDEEVHSLILHYKDSVWTRETAAERLMGSELVFISGSSSDNIYIASMFGTMFHYDGSSWKKVNQSMFVEPSSGADKFGLCTSSTVTQMETWCTGTGMGFTIYAEVTSDGTLYTGVGHGNYEVVSTDEANCPPGQNRCILTHDFAIIFSDYIVEYNGTDWNTIDLPDYPQYTGADASTFSMGIWPVQTGQIYTPVLAANTEEDALDGLFESKKDGVTKEILFWDGTVWTPIAIQPDDSIFFIKGSQKGDFYGTGIETSSFIHYQSCDF